LPVSKKIIYISTIWILLTHIFIFHFLGVKVSVSIAQLLAKKATATVTLRNPLDTAYTLTKLQSQVYFPGKSGSFLVGHVDSIPEPCTVPQKGQNTCSDWSVSLDANIV
jgi:hypothetical protein